MPGLQGAVRKTPLDRPSFKLTGWTVSELSETLKLSDENLSRLSRGDSCKMPEKFLESCLLSIS